jgi:hypothetical protein
MRYSASIYAHDVMDQVWLTAHIMEHSQDGGSVAVEVAALATSFAGVGEPDPHERLRDALIAVLESL